MTSQKNVLSYKDLLSSELVTVTFCQALQCVKAHTPTHTNTHAVMSCSSPWFSSFQVHPLLKPEISLSGLSMSLSLCRSLPLSLIWNPSFKISPRSTCHPLREQNDPPSLMHGGDGNANRCELTGLQSVPYGHRDMEIGRGCETNKSVVIVGHVSVRWQRR